MLALPSKSLTITMFDLVLTSSYRKLREAELSQSGTNSELRVQSLGSRSNRLLPTPHCET